MDKPLTLLRSTIYFHMWEQQYRLQNNKGLSSNKSHFFHSLSLVTLSNFLSLSMSYHSLYDLYDNVAHQSCQKKKDKQHIHEQQVNRSYSHKLDKTNLKPTRKQTTKQTTTMNCTNRQQQHNP